MAAKPPLAEPRDLNKTARRADQARSDARLAKLTTDAIRSDGTLVLSRDQQILLMTALKLTAIANDAESQEKRRAAASIELQDPEGHTPVVASNLRTKAARVEASAKKLRDLADLLYDAREIRVKLSPSQLAAPETDDADEDDPTDMGQPLRNGGGA